MKSTAPQNHILFGIVLAVAATIIWSGNFIIARSVINDIPPITLAFFRWLTAVTILTPIAWKPLCKVSGLRSTMPKVSRLFIYTLISCQSQDT